MPKSAILPALSMAMLAKASGKRGVILPRENAEEAADFLRRMANRTHEVRTCVVVTTGSGNALRLLTQTSVSQVTLGPVTDAQIAQYCATNEPFDKAGGYAIQGLAAVFVARIEGSFSGVMGLPLYETAQLLRQAGVPVL